MMIYFKKTETNEIYGYDESDETQLPYIDAAIENGWIELKDYPPVPDKAAALLEQKSGAKIAVESYISGIRQRIAGTGDVFEVAAWPNKLRIAMEILDGVATESGRAAFELELKTRNIQGETVEMLAQKVIRNASAFEPAAGFLDGLKRATNDAINAAQTKEEIDSIVEQMKSEITQKLGV